VRKNNPRRSKRAFGPLVPSSERPLVLPGGRRWYRPKDAYNDEFIAETLSAQAELITGSTLGWVAPLPILKPPSSILLSMYIPPYLLRLVGHVWPCLPWSDSASVVASHLISSHIIALSAEQTLAPRKTTPKKCPSSAWDFLLVFPIWNIHVLANLRNRNLVILCGQGKLWHFTAVFSSIQFFYSFCLPCASNAANNFRNWKQNLIEI